MRILKEDCRGNLPAPGRWHMPGEFESHQGCVMIWPWRPGSWNYGAVKAQEAFVRVAEAIGESERVYMLVPRAEWEKARRAFGRRAAVPADGADALGAKPALGVKPALDGETALGAEAAAFERPEDARIVLLPIESDDAWARDTGPTFVADGQGGLAGIDWQFNAWGGAYDGLYPEWERDDAVASQVCQALGIDCMDARPFVLEGGSIHSDGEGTLLVTEACLLSPGRNPSMTKAEIEETLKLWLGAQKVIWLPRGIYNDETNEHVDNVCAFVRPGEVVLAWTDDPADPQYAMSQADLAVLERERDARGRSFLVHKLPIPSQPVCMTKEDVDGFVFVPGEDEREPGERLAASYVNFYISNGGIIFPQFGDPMDEEAARILGECFPDRRLYPIDALAIIKGGGNIHCITQQIPGQPRRM